MSERFYGKFLSLFFGFVVLMILIVVATEFLVFYLLNQNMILHFGFCGMLLALLIYGTKYCVQFRDLREKLYLFFPSEPEKPHNPLNIETDDLPLKVCLKYRNGSSLNNIQKDLQLTHPMQAKRELRRGLDILLRSYNSNHEEKVTL